MDKKMFLKACEIKLMKLKDFYSKFLEPQKAYPGENEKNSRLIAIKTDPMRREAISVIPEIVLALKRIRNGTFGICEATGKQMCPKMLLSTPWKRTST